MPDPTRLAVLLSGAGTTMQNLLDRAADGRLRAARVACAVSSRADAAGVERGRRAGVPTYVVERRGCPSAEEFSARILGHCRAHGADLIVLAGFLQLLHIPDDYRGRVVNIHPALLPAFGGKGFHGLHVHRAVLDAGVKLTGCTAHLADDEYDRGAILVQRACPVKEEDTPESLAARVFAEECEALPEAISLLASGRVRVEGRRARILPDTPSP
jgi:phosphoribosylglycinamide formyltransferase-1